MMKKDHIHSQLRSRFGIWTLSSLALALLLTAALLIGYFIITSDGILSLLFRGIASPVSGQILTLAVRWGFRPGILPAFVGLVLVYNTVVSSIVLAPLLVTSWRARLFLVSASLAFVVLMHHWSWKLWQ